MIPLHLYLSGFLSYREPTELDFRSFDLACISGPNGSGKSSLLDAITWSLFGQARRRDESMINSQSEAAEVIFTFSYEGNVYRVQRANRRGKTSELHFYILQDGQEGSSQNWSPKSEARTEAGSWKPLDERTLRETQERVQETLRLDYETFVNASFFLQGKADLFTQQRPGDRKRILSSILGLEIWETYRLRAADQRRSLEREIDALDGRIAEIDAELAEAPERKARLAELQSELERLSKLRLAQEQSLESIRKISAALAEQKKFVESLARQVQTASDQITELDKKLSSRQEEQENYTATLARADQIAEAHRLWEQARLDLGNWDEIASRFREQEKQRQGPLDEINATRARLIQEGQDLDARSKSVSEQANTIPDLLAQLDTLTLQIKQAEEQSRKRETMDTQLQAAHQAQANAKAENVRLKTAMDELKDRIDQLSIVEGALCPLCGQPLTPEDRQRLIDNLNIQGKEMGDRYRENQSVLSDSEDLLGELEQQMKSLARVDGELRSYAQRQAELSTRLVQIQEMQTIWERDDLNRLREVETLLANESFAPEARLQLAAIDKKLKETGYDPAAHEAARQAELAGRSAESELRALERAQAALVPLEREIADLQEQIKTQQQVLIENENEHKEATAKLASAKAQAPDERAAERELFDLQERENQLLLEVGAARQKVDVLDSQKTRRQDLEKQRHELTRQVGDYKQLERAFSKDGVPALLIEQALPQIEAKTNEILDRLSQGNMSVRFLTQAAYKDTRRDDLRETLDIQISDQAGTRDYEMFSGGEAFRVNFAIRLALSEVLAQRAGARLQTLVIDEGFGSQDEQGRQRLVEAINLVRGDFAKVLVITHIDELKDVFPNRIEVTKTENGSSLTVI